MLVPKSIDDDLYKGLTDLRKSYRDKDILTALGNLLCEDQNTYQDLKEVALDRARFDFASWEDGRDYYHESANACFLAARRLDSLQRIVFDIAEMP